MQKPPILLPKNTPPESMAAPERQFFALLAEKSWPFQVAEHQPTHTAADSEFLLAYLSGGRSKSLLLQDKKGRLLLIVARGTSQVDLKQAKQAIGATGRLSFAPPHVMVTTLGVEPGHLSPAALTHPKAQDVTHVILDTNLAEEDVIWFHPLRNTASVALSSGDLCGLIEHLHSPPIIHPIGLVET